MGTALYTYTILVIKMVRLGNIMMKYIHAIWQYA